MSLDGRVIGLIEDDTIMGESIVQRLALEGCAVTWWQNGEEALERLSGVHPEAVVCDIRLPDMSGEDVFRSAACEQHAPPFLFITAFGEIDQAIRLIRQGAGDYVTKPFEMNVFLDRLASLLPEDPAPDSGVLGVSPPMREIEKLLRRLAKVSSAVVLTGETGVGKEVCARFLHGVSPAAAKPFMAVNCAAIPAELMESELFGHEQGAFTGARARHRGYAERAGEGVLFLDEIAELPPHLQAKLLRLVEERVFSRVGGEQPIPFKARLVCATNTNLDEAVKAGLFREDLYYRINVVALEIPPLRDRPEDISLLLDRFVKEFAAVHGAGVIGVGALAEEVALAHDWPGNVRELRNRAERAVALALHDWLAPSDLFPERGRGGDSGDAALSSLTEVRDAAERRQILRALEATGGQAHLAAKLLGIARTTLWEKMKRLGIPTRSDGK